MKNHNNIIIQKKIEQKNHNTLYKIIVSVKLPILNYYPEQINFMQQEYTTLVDTFIKYMRIYIYIFLLFIHQNNNECPMCVCILFIIAIISYVNYKSSLYEKDNNLFL